MTSEERQAINGVYREAHLRNKKAYRSQDHQTYDRGFANGVAAVMRVVGYSDEAVLAAWALPEGKEAR